MLAPIDASMMWAQGFPWLGFVTSKCLVLWQLEVQFWHCQAQANFQAQCVSLRIIARVLGNLQQCRSGLGDLYPLVMVQKHWPSDAHDSYTYKRGCCERVFCQVG